MKTKAIILSVVASTLFPPTYAKNTKEQNETREVSETKLEVYPAKLSQLGGKETIEYNGKYLLKLSKALKLDTKNFKLTKKGEMFFLTFNFSKKQIKYFQKMTEQYKNFRLAMVYKGKILIAPQIKSVINTPQVQLTFHNDQSLKPLLLDLGLTQS